MLNFRNVSVSLLSENSSTKMSIIKISAAVAGALIVSKLTYNLIFCTRNRKKPDLDSNLIDIRPYCVQCGETKMKNAETCGHGTGLEPLYDILRSAEKSIDICMYLFTDKTISTIFLEKLKRGLKIRIITDGEMAFANKSCIAQLQDAGIPVKWERSIHSVHHKCCLIDSELYLTGSFNWTLQATNGNYENLIIITNVEGVEKYCNTFNHLWEKFQPFDKDAIDLRALPPIANHSRD